MRPTALTAVQQLVGRQSPLEASGSFVSTNEQCPIIGLAIDSEFFSVTKERGGDFTVLLLPEMLDSVGEFSYTVTAMAEGGALASAPSQMFITENEHNCFSGDLIQINKPQATFELPLPGEVTEHVIFESSLDYISAPVAGCR